MSALPSLAASLASRVGSRLQLLELLCSSSSTAAAAAATGTTTSGDIRRFCGISELHKAALCVVAAVLYSGDLCWELCDVLVALDAAVGGAGPAILSQPDLLLSVVRLYAQVEQQLTSDLQHQQHQLHTDHAVAFETADLAADSMHDQAPLCPPAAIVRALGRMSAAHLTQLQPGDVAAGWVLSQPTVLPGPARLLLQQWMQQLLAPQAAAAQAGTGGARPGTALGSTQTPPAAAASQSVDGSTQGHFQHQKQQQQGKQKQQQDEHLSQQLQLQQQADGLWEALLAALLQHPAALSAVLRLLQDCLENLHQQRAHAAAWMAALTAVLLQVVGRGEALTNTTPFNQQNQQLQGSAYALQLLLCGDSGNLPAEGNLPAGAAAAAASADTAGGLHGSNKHSMGLMLLTMKALTAMAAGWPSSWGQVHLMLATSKCLTAVAAALSSVAVSGAVRQQEGGQQWLLQQGEQQVSEQQLVFGCVWVATRA